jgi:putative DNA primase/helicase
MTPENFTESISHKQIDATLNIAIDTSNLDDSPIDKRSQASVDSCVLSQPKPIQNPDFPHPPKNIGGVVLATTDNLRYMLSMYGIKVQHNLVKKKTTIRVPHLDPTTPNAHAVAYALIQDLAILNKFPTTNLPSQLEAIGFLSAFNPVEDWIRSKPWDGLDRIQAIVNTLRTKPGYLPQLKHALIYKWLLSCVAAAASKNGFHTRGVLTLQGPQGCGKTSWIKALVNDVNMQADWIKTDHQLDPTNKDSVITAVSHFIVELGELDSTFSKDVGRLKGFITGSVDKVRRPYGHVDAEYPRQTVFAATVNEHNFLLDPTGNNRWWTLPVTEIDFSHQIDMQQLFAQLLMDFEAGKNWWLTPEENDLLNDYNNDHMTASPMEERLDDLLDFSEREPSKLKALKASQVLELLGNKNPTNKQAKECGGILRSKLGEPKNIKGYSRWYVCIKSHRHEVAPQKGAFANDDDRF